MTHGHLAVQASLGGLFGKDASDALMRFADQMRRLGDPPAAGTPQGADAFLAHLQKALSKG